MNSWNFGFESQVNSVENLSQPVRDILNNGYTIIRNSVSSEYIDIFLNDYKELKISFLENYKQDLDSEDCVNGMFRRLVNLHLKVPFLRSLFSKNQALLTTDFLFKEQTTLYTSLYYEIGSFQDLHRDTPYFWTNPGYKYFGVWLALEDVGPENGALEIIPGSHKVIDDFQFRNEIGLIERRNGAINPYSAELWDVYQKRVHEKCIKAGLKREVVSINKGDTIIWHPQLVHGGSKNADTKSRNSFVMHVTPKNFLVYNQDKYFSPDLDEIIPSKDTGMEYLLEEGRQMRNEKIWSIAQKIFLPV